MILDIVRCSALELARILNDDQPLGRELRCSLSEQPVNKRCFAAACSTSHQNIPVIANGPAQELFLFWRQNPRVHVLIEAEHAARPFAHRERGGGHDRRDLAGNRDPSRGSSHSIVGFSRVIVV